MSIHVLPATAASPDDSLRWQQLGEVSRLCATYLRVPTSIIDDGTTLSLVFTPDLTPTEVARLDRIFGVVKLRLGLTPDDYQVIIDAIPTLSGYLNAPSPTNAQTIAALKSAITVLRAVLRN